MTPPVQTLLNYEAPVLADDGTAFRACARGRLRDDGLWEGWFELTSIPTGAVLATERETTQPNLTDLEYWATGISHVYLEGALRRAVARTYAA